MPKTIEDLLLNCKRAGNREWSRKLISEYKARALEILRQNLEAGRSVEYEELCKFLRERETAADLKELPLEFPVNPQQLTNPKVYIPVEFSKRMAAQFPLQMNNENFDEWLPLFENYFTLAGHDVKLKGRYLLHCIGAGSIKLLKAIKPETIDKIDYTVLVAKAGDIFSPTDKRQASIKFFNLTQGSDNIRDYSLKLRDQAEKSGISDENFITDKLINGLSSQKIKFELLKEADKTPLEELIKLGTLLEECEKNSGYQMAGGSQINKVNTYKNKDKFKHKDNKNKKDNKSDKDKKADKGKMKCYFCKKYGHMKKECTKYLAWKEKKEKESGSKVNELQHVLGSVHL